MNVEQILQKHLDRDKILDMAVLEGSKKGLNVEQTLQKHSTSGEDRGIDFNGDSGAGTATSHSQLKVRKESCMRVFLPLALYILFIPSELSNNL